MAKPFKPIPYGRQTITAEDVACVVDTLGSDFLTSGPQVSLFEEELASLAGAKHAIACSNATAGLHLACMALDLPSGGLAITTPITFVASSNCFEYVGLRSDFVDIDPKTRCLSVDALEKYCLTKEIPQVVVMVSFAGVPADLPRVFALSRRFGFKVIEDAAHAIGSRYVSDGAWHHSGGCAHSDLAVFSFHPVKTITTGEGGAVLTNDDEVAKRLRRLRSHGIERGQAHIPKGEGAWYYEMLELGFNYRITDIQCALGRSQLRRLASIKGRRREIVDHYTRALSSVPGLTPPVCPADTDPCFHLAAVELPGGASDRKRIYEHLVARGVQPQVHYIPVYWHPYYRQKYGYAPGKCPHAEEYYARCLSLPLYEGLSDTEVAYVIDTLVDAIGPVNAAGF
ncbi:MAG: UDP-4-amino-4,6-dideoxy-N-acetyl-beta-L-altrosamine transaminase [Pseudomonadota bacterium]|jgi:UDP-4-amino-4,6-dideoxy-N-acetyl-beta-L-altrosamine transaminase